MFRLRRVRPYTHLISISRIQIENGVEISILRLRGAIAPATREDLGARLAEAGARSPFLVVDLSELDGTEGGEEELLTQARLQERRDGWMRLVAPPDRPAHALRHALGERDDLPPRFRTVDSPEDALADLPGRAA